jgi:protease II
MFFYFSCRPTSVSVDVTNIQLIQNDQKEKDQLKITVSHSHTFIVDNPESNSTSEIYYSANNKTAYVFFVNTTEGKINFRVLDKDSVNDKHSIFIGSMNPIEINQTNISDPIIH